MCIRDRAATTGAAATGDGTTGAATAGVGTTTGATAVVGAAAGSATGVAGSSNKSQMALLVAAGAATSTVVTTVTYALFLKSMGGAAETIVPDNRVNNNKLDNFIGGITLGV